MRIFIFSLISLIPHHAIALSETFNLYDSPQGLSMGNALTADAVGYQASYYNPACLGKATLKDWEAIPVALEGIFGLNAFGEVQSTESFGIAQISTNLESSPDKYYYHRINFVPAVSRRGIAFSVLGAHTFAGRSSGVRMDVNAITDVVPNISGSVNLAGNLLKLGLTAKAVFRQQLKGNYLHGEINHADKIAPLMSQGLGFGADLGMHFTLPYSWLPSIALVWKDVLDTRFTTQSPLFFGETAGRPDKIPQSFNAALSVHPYIDKVTHLTLAAEWKHIEDPSVKVIKRLHFGVQFETKKTVYLWAGMGQMYWSAGAGLRIRGGNFEVGSYGAEVGTNDAPEEDRRVFFRYTLGF